MDRERSELVDYLMSEGEEPTPDRGPTSDEEFMIEELDKKRAELDLRLNRRYRQQAFVVPKASLLRAGFEFVLPILVGVYTIFILIF